MNFSNLKLSKIDRLPKTAGVYSFKKGREFLYIGKAANIRERVRQHKDLLGLAKQLGYIKTDSEIEALILEANLIKKYQPKYNVVWKDDKNYFFVGITKENYPRVFWTHQTKLEIDYVGPFVDGGALKQTLKILRKVFPYRSCRTLPKRPCLWYHLDRCPAPCLLKSKRECQQNAKNLMKVFLGKKSQTIIDLKKEMKIASDSQDFEKAAKIRDQIEALEKVLAHAKIFGEASTAPPSGFWPYKRIEAYDVSNIQGQEATGAMVTFINGLPDKNFYRKFKIKIAGKPDDIAMIKEVLKRRFRHSEWGFPDLIVIDGGRAQLNAALHCSRFYLEQKVRVMALAKKENKLHVEGKKKPILLKSLPREIFNLILQLRDEAHRFAQSYHRKLRKKALLGD